MVAVSSIDKQRMRGNFSDHAGDYDSYALVQKRVVEILKDRLAEKDLHGSLLDIGTGTGALATALHMPGSTQQLILMDIAHGMTREASGRLGSASACDGDARLLPFANQSFNTVVSSSVYQWVEDLSAAFSEACRVLAPGGLFAVALFGEKTLFELRDSHRSAIEKAGSRRSSHAQDFPSLAEVQEAISVSGLSCIEATSQMEVEYHRDVPELMRQLKQIGASNASSERPRGLASRKVMQAMIQEYEKSFRDDYGLPASYEVIVALARKGSRKNRKTELSK